MSHNKNYVGEIIGKFTVLDIKISGKGQKSKTYLYCKCNKCEKEKWIAKKHVRTTKCCDGNKTTCFSKKDYSNLSHNGITFIERTDKKKRSSYVWKCKCFCGKIFYEVPANITSDIVRSCGCSSIKYVKENLEKASLAYKQKYIVENTNLAVISSKSSTDSISGRRGVIWRKDKNKWCAQIEFQKKRYFLGYYDNLEDAIKAREMAEEKYFKPILKKYNKE